MRAENGAQTRDPQLGRLVLYQLSYFRKLKEWVVMDSNHRRHSQQIYSLPHLATLVTTQKLYISKASAKVMLLFDITKFFRHFFLFSFKKCSFSPIK